MPVIMEGMIAEGKILMEMLVMMRVIEVAAVLAKEKHSSTNENSTARREKKVMHSVPQAGSRFAFFLLFNGRRIS